MFADRVRVRVTGGGGGDGCCSFRREKYVPRGGPNGGDGGHGANIYFEAAVSCASLQDLRYHSHWVGERGEHGQGSDCHGKCRDDRIILVPLGTIVRDYETGEVRADLVEEGQRFLAAQGGRGGRGNARFANATHKVPRFAELGEPGEEAEYRLEVKLIADVGIVGLPNAGKSTLLSVVTAARPKIADYPFTTLSPNLGVVTLSDYRTLTLADIPGIIEGAAQGKGLGHDFLRHIERTRVLLFVLDLGDPEPVQTYATLEQELAAYSAVFATRPRVVVLNKADITENRARFETVAPSFEHPFLISGATREGVGPLLEHLWSLVEQARNAPDEPLLAPVDGEYAYVPPYTIRRVDRGFRVEGKRIAQAVHMTNFDNEEAVRFLHHRLERMGVLKALKRMGAQEGQAIAVEDFEFEYHSD